VASVAMVYGVLPSIILILTIAAIIGAINGLGTLCANMSDTTLLDNLGYNSEQRSVQR
jgi:hypothetical protein